MQTGSTKSTQETDLYTHHDWLPVPYAVADEGEGLDFYAGIRKLADGHQIHLGVTARNVEWALATDRAFRWLAAVAGLAFGLSLVAVGIALFVWHNSG